MKTCARTNIYKHNKHTTHIHTHTHTQEGREEGREKGREEGREGRIKEGRE